MVMRRRFFNNNTKIIDINDYLTIEALEDNLQVYFPYRDLMYSIDGLMWQKLLAGTYSPVINRGQTISFKGNIQSHSTDIKRFTITKKCNLLGNCMSLTFHDAPNFYALFSDCETIVSVSKNFLPATTLSKSCYTYMFNGCSSLTTAPELPATTLAESCYSGMFSGCTSLTTAPELSATTLTKSCYHAMFSGCTSLTTAPILPATTLTVNCYLQMFYSCSSLTTAPELPATALAESCYSRMFRDCTSIVNAPVLPATTLAPYCYVGMFENCYNLNYIKMLATDISANRCLSDWVDGVAVKGTFVKNKNATWDVTGTSGVPKGWTVEFDN